MTVFLMILMLGLPRPDSLKLKDVYNKARAHYPLMDQVELQQKITDLQLKKIQTGNYPQVNVSGQATYQSDVTSVNLGQPGSSGPKIDKDQYKVGVDFVQPIYNAGKVDTRKDLEKVKADLVKNSVDVDFHKVREQVDQVYFGILLLQKQQASIEWVMKKLDARLSSIQSKVKNGVLLPSVEHNLRAERLKAEQDLTDVKSQMRASYGVLNEITGENFSTQDSLAVPNPSITANLEVPQSRPEYEVFRDSKRQLSYQEDLARAQKMPTISAFATTAYGRPGLNLFKNEFQPYYIIGIRARWNFWDFINGDRDEESLKLESRKVEAQQESFTQGLRASLHNDIEKIQDIRDQIARDKEIIKLREQVADESASQLENGAITSSDYVDALYNAQQARLSQEMHNIQLIQTKIQYSTKLGISWK